MKDWLLSEALSDEMFVDRYRERFQSRLREAAQGVVTRRARMLGVKAMVSPYPLLDGAAALFQSFLMVAELCRIYNVRTGKIGTLRILLKIVFHTYIAGKVDEWEDSVGKTVAELLQEAGLPSAMGTVVGKFSAKSAAAYFNYRLLRRIGLETIALLQPVPDVSS